MKFALLVLLILTGLMATAQQSIKSIVADSLTKRVLPFATVQTADKKKSVITGINGSFSMSCSLKRHAPQRFLYWSQYKSHCA
jgi:peroxiredoxin